MSQLDEVNVYEAPSHTTMDTKVTATITECLERFFCFRWQELVFILGKVGSYFTKAWCPVAFSKSGL